MSLMQDHAAIFDMDGVLVDSYDAHYRSWQRLADEAGVEFTEEQFAASFGMTSRDILTALFDGPHFTAEHLVELDNRKERLYRELLMEDFPAMDGAAELIDALREGGFRLAVGTSGPPENVQLVLDRLGRRQAFDTIVDRSHITRGKPDPQVFQVAAAHLGVDHTRCAVLEDAPSGIAAARAAGMAGIGIVSSGRTAEQLAAADLVVSSLRELTPEIIAKLIDARPA